MTNPDHLRLESYLPYRFSIIAERMSRYLASVYGQEFGLSQQEWRVLHILSESVTRTTQEVIERTSLDRLKVSRAAIRLEDKGLIARISHPQDQRAHLMQITAKGSKIYQEIVPVALEFQQFLMAELTPDEANTLNTILERLLHRLKQRA